MTPKVTKRIRSRPGKAAPESVVSGIARAAASETAPRIPDQELTMRSRQVERFSLCEGRRSTRRNAAVVPKPQAKRIAITTSAASSAYQAASPVLKLVWPRPSMITGSCRPISTKSVALSMKVSNSQTVSVCRRVCGPASSGAR